VTPAPSEKRKVARGALLCSQGRWFDGDMSIADDAGNLTPNPFPSGKGNRTGILRFALNDTKTAANDG
jgi:hypothetical protein